MNSFAIRIGQRDVLVELSAAAESALERREAPLVAEMELYFSCLIRKQVRFPAGVHPGALCAPSSGALTVCFRPVMTRACSVRDTVGKPELEDFPIARPQAFIPHWLKLDCRDGTWTGEFGY